MNVVVRAKVNASTDYAGLCASLMVQRDAKQKPIHQLELNVLQELAPQLDEVIRLELECKAANLELEMAEEEVEVVRRQVEQAKRQGAVEAEEDKRALVEVLNQRAAATEELEAVLMKLADNAEMREIQAEHEEHKKSMLKALQKAKKKHKLQLRLHKLLVFPQMTHEHAELTFASLHVVELL